MADPKEALNVAEKLVHAYMLVCSSVNIICKVDDGDELTKRDINVLRDDMPDIEDELRAVLAALVAGKLAEVE